MRRLVLCFAHNMPGLLLGRSCPSIALRVVLFKVLALGTVLLALECDLAVQYTPATAHRSVFIRWHIAPIWYIALRILATANLAWVLHGT